MGGPMAAALSAHPAQSLQRNRLPAQWAAGSPDPRV